MLRLRVEQDGVEVWEPTFDDLSALPEQVAHPSILFGGLSVGALRLRSLLAVLPLAELVTFRSSDGSTATFRVEELDDALLVYRLGGEPLPAPRGGPFRLVLDSDPARSLKFVISLELSSTLSSTVIGEVTPAQTQHERAA